MRRAPPPIARWPRRWWAWTLAAALACAAQARAQRVAEEPTLAPIGAPAPGASGASEPSEQERQAFSARYGRALSRKLGLLQALDELDRKVAEFRARLERLAVRRAAAAEALSLAQTRVAGAERRLQQMRRAVRTRLRALIGLRTSPGVRFVFARAEFARSVVQDRVLRKLVEGDRARLARYRAQLAHVRSVTEARNRAVTALDALDAGIQRERAAMEEQRRDKQALIAQIESDPVYHARVGIDLEQAHEELRARIATLEQWRERQHSFSQARGTLPAPVDHAEIELPFGPHRHPRFHTTTFHRGVDLRPRRGGTAPVRAVFWGRVAFVGWQTGYGQTVMIDHGEGWHTVYGHLDEVQVRTGEVVAPGARLADVGASGSLKGRHLTFELREGGVPRDPAQWVKAWAQQTP